LTAVARHQTAQRDARAVRRELEESLGGRVSDWPWSARLSRWLDVLLVIEASA
jgi:hypothetical protein